jgi:hypothetical protein
VVIGAKAHKREVKSVRAALGVLLLGVLCSAATPAAALPDEPLGGVAIVVEQEGGAQVVAKGITGADGRTRFYLRAGSYRLTVSQALKALELAAAQRARATPASAQPRVDTTVSITVQMTAFGTSRERRFAVAALTDGMESMAFETAVSSPVTVLVVRNEE